MPGLEPLRAVLHGRAEPDGARRGVDALPDEVDPALEGLLRIGLGPDRDRETLVEQGEVLLVGVEEDPDAAQVRRRVTSGWSASTSDPA